MQIVCPSCESAYEVPQAVLVAAQRVQCVKCENQWTPLPDPVPVAPPPPVRPSAMSDADFAGRARTREPEPASPADPGLRPDIAPLIAWAASILLLIGLGWAGLHWREGLMHAWPASTRLFAALGLRPVAM